MSHKVLTFNITSTTRIKDKTGDIKEIEFPKLNSYLDDGYEVINVYQTASSSLTNIVTITFVLNLEENKRQKTF